MWAPAAAGRNFDLTPSALSPLDPFRDHLTIISNTDVSNAEAFEAPEIGGDHFRSSAVFLTQMHPRQTQGSDVRVGTSLDQQYAQKFGQETAIPSLQLCIENVDQAGGCSYGYSCVYTDSISWAAPDQPLPMVRDPRAVFDVLFGVGATPQDRAERRSEDRSILDWIGQDVSRLKNTLGSVDRARLSDYLEDIREIERRLQRVEAQNTQRRTARAARRADRRARLVRRAHQADVRPAGAGLRVRHHPGLRLQARTRRVEPRLRRQRRHHRLPLGVAPRRSGRPRHGVRAASTAITSAWCRISSTSSAARRTATATCSRTRWCCTDRRWATRTCTTTSAARCSSPATPAAGSRAACTSRPPTARRWPTPC